MAYTVCCNNMASFAQILPAARIKLACPPPVARARRPRRLATDSEEEAAWPQATSSHLVQQGARSRPGHGSLQAEVESEGWDAGGSKAPRQRADAGRGRRLAPGLRRGTFHWALLSDCHAGSRTGAAYTLAREGGRRFVGGHHCCLRNFASNELGAVA